MSNFPSVLLMMSHLKHSLCPRTASVRKSASDDLYLTVVADVESKKDKSVTVSFIAVTP